MQCPVTLDIAEDTDAALGPAYTVTRKLIKAGASPVSLIPNTMQPRLNCVSILVILLVTVLDLLLQLSTLRCSWQTFRLISASMKISK